MSKTTLTAIHYDLPQGVTVHAWADKKRSTLQGSFERQDADGYDLERYSITAHYDHATDDVCTVVLNACNHTYADSAFKAQREAITRELVDRVAKANPATPTPVATGAYLTINGRPACEYFGHMAGMDVARKAGVDPVCGYPGMVEACIACGALRAIGVQAGWEHGQCPVSAADTVTAQDFAADSVTKRICDGVDPFHGRGGVDFPPLPLGNRDNATGAVLRELARNLAQSSEADFESIARALVARLGAAGITGKGV